MVLIVCFYVLIVCFDVHRHSPDKHYQGISTLVLFFFTYPSHLGHLSRVRPIRDETCTGLETSNHDTNENSQIPKCNVIFAVMRNGDTCSGRIIPTSPNLECNKLFVGEWVSVGGSLN